MDTLLYETDWLPTRPVFFNERTGRASWRIDEVIDYENLEFDPEGFNNYLEFGYSVFEQTPVRHVKFLRHSSRLWRDDNGKLRVERLADPMETLVGRRVPEEALIEKIRSDVHRWERASSGPLIIPTSAGYDSRLLNWCVADKTRVYSFSYGVADDQSTSHEVVYAQRLSELLGTRWERIPLGDFHRYIDDWLRLFGPSTHAHGMYHFEFYYGVRERLPDATALLTGVGGDWWSSNVGEKAIDTPESLATLGYTHGMHADRSQSVLRDGGTLRQAFFEENRAKLRDWCWQNLLTGRIKQMLITYLSRVPEALGFRPFAPYLDAEVAAAMLSLAPERRRERRWQREFFLKQGLDLQSLHLPASYGNTLHVQALRRVPLAPLDERLLREVVKPDYVRWINGRMQSASRRYSWVRRRYPMLVNARGCWRLYQALNNRYGREDRHTFDAYYAYLTLKPIETLLRKARRTPAV